MFECLSWSAKRQPKTKPRKSRTLFSLILEPLNYYPAKPITLKVLFRETRNLPALYNPPNTSSGGILDPLKTCPKKTLSEGSWMKKNGRNHVASTASRFCYRRFLAQTTSLVQASVLRSATGMEMPCQNDGEGWCGGNLQNG